VEDKELLNAYTALRVLLRKALSFEHIKEIIALAGIPIYALSKLRQEQGASKSQLMNAVDPYFERLDTQSKGHFLRIAAERLLEDRPDLSDKLDSYLRPLGWQLADTAIIPLNIVDLTDFDWVPSGAHPDLLKAAERLRDGDESGAIGAACGAVDTVTEEVYRQHDLGDPGNASFQERVSKSLDSLASLPHVSQALVDLGWDESASLKLGKNLKGALNQAAYVVQELRPNMGDVHGTKSLSE